MSPFNFKKKRVEDKSRFAELVFDHAGTTTLVFGLQWRSIVTSDTKKAGVTMARAQKATHLLLRGQQVGHCTIDTKANPQIAQGGIDIYPAAQVAARQYGGDAIFLVNIGEGEYWLCLVRNGAPTSTDTFLLGSNDSEAAEKAAALHQGVSGESGRLTMYTNLGSGQFDWPVKPVSVEDLFLAASHEEDRLVAMPKASVSIPKPVLIGACVGVGLLAAQQGYKMWEAKKRAELAALNRVDSIDPAAAWGKALSDWEASRALPNGGGLVLAREAIGALPLYWDGWTLVGAKCAAAPRQAAAPTRNWNCNASYERTAAAALNREIAPQVPKAWTVTFTQLNKMQMNWQLSQPVQPVKSADFKSASFHTVETASLLQRLASAISQDVKLQFLPVNITPPKQTDGTAMPVDTRVAGLKEAAFAIGGPLRTIDAVIDSNVNADWTSLSIAFSVSPAAAIKSSSITAEALGVLYAKN